MLARVCYDISSNIKSTHRERTTQMSYVSGLLQDKRVFRTGSGASGYKALFRFEQKNIVWKKNIVRKFTLYGGLVVDRWVDRFSVANTCKLITALAFCRVCLGLGLCRFESSIIDREFCLSCITKRVKYFRGRRCVARCFPISQSHGRTGP